MAPSDWTKLKDKHVLILGGSAGIGHAVADASLAAGAHVTISSSSQPRLDAAAAAFRADYPDRIISAIACDLSQTDDALEPALDALFTQAAAQAGGRVVNHVVWTASPPLHIKPFAELTPQFIREAARWRLEVPLMIAKVAGRHLPKTPNSSFTLTSGGVGERPRKDWAVLAGLGAGLFGLTRALALELAPVRANCVRPGYVRSTLWSGHSAEFVEAMEKGVAQRVPTGKVATGVEVAEGYLWVMKDENANAAIVATDGGALLV